METFLKVVGFIIFAVIIGLIAGYLTMAFWNYVFGSLLELTYSQGIVLNGLAGILFGDTLSSSIKAKAE